MSLLALVLLAQALRCDPAAGITPRTMTITGCTVPGPTPGSPGVRLRYAPGLYPGDLYVVPEQRPLWTPGPGDPRSPAW